jgi:hypothetical protein
VEVLDLGPAVRELSGRCPSCHRSFRMHCATAIEGLVREMARRLPLANADEITRGPDAAICPYCGRRAGVAAFLVKAQDEFLEATANWVAALVTFEQLAFIEQTLGQNPYQTFYAMKPVAPERPEPAPNGLRPVPLGCCGGRIDLDPDWCGEIRCPYCAGSTSPPA